MKHVTGIFPLLFVFGLLASCGGGPSAEQKTAADQAKADSVKAAEEATKSAVLADPTMPGPFPLGFCNEKSKYNICAQLREGAGTGGNAVLVVSVVRLSSKTPIHSITLDGLSAGVEIWLDSNGELMFQNFTGGLKNQKKTIGLDQQNSGPDMKISAAVASAIFPNDPPALVGMNDARNGSIVQLNSVVGNLASSMHFVAHFEGKSTNSGDLTLSYSSLGGGKLKTGSYCADTELKIPCFGCGFNWIPIGCDPS